MIVLFSAYILYSWLYLLTRNGSLHTAMSDLSTQLNGVIM